MTARSKTSDPHRLELFLRNQLPEDAQHELEIHLLVCAECRDKLDELAGGGQWWSRVRQYLGSDSVVNWVRAPDATVPRPAGNVDLDFLDPSDNPDLLGRLGPYDVLEVIGRGGMGVVLKAFDPALHRPVAI